MFGKTGGHLKSQVAARISYSGVAKGQRVSLAAALARSCEKHAVVSLGVCPATSEEAAERADRIGDVGAAIAVEVGDDQAGFRQLDRDGTRDDVARQK